MKKLSFLLSVLITFSFVSISHASSGDITIGTKTYTQSEVQKQIVQPILKRLEKQKIAKTKLRLINLAIRQYTNKQKIAQKQGKIDLVNFYGTIIATLKGEVSKIPVISISTTNNTSSQNKPKQNTTTTNGSVTNNGGSLINNTNVITGQNGTAEQKIQYLIQKEIISLYISGGEANQRKTDFFKLLEWNGYESGSYAIAYANTLKFNDTISASGTTSSSKGSTVNNGGTTTVGGQTNNDIGTPSGTKEETVQFYIRMDIYEAYSSNGGANQSKSVFVNFITQQYGNNTYALEYVNTLKFNKP